MMRLAPQVRQSGQTRLGGLIMESGNWWVRTVLVGAAWRWVSQEQKAAARYRHLVANTGSAQVALATKHSQDAARPSSAGGSAGTRTR